MSPFESIKKLYRRFPQPRSFAQDLASYVQNGHVIINTPEIFIMGRACVRDHPEVTNPWHRFDHPDCWYVQAAALAPGVSQDIFLTVIPYPLMWVCFGRNDGPLRYYKFSRICEMIARFQTRS